MPEQKKTEWATIGTIVAPFGVRGEMKVFSLSDVPDRFARLSAVYLTPDYRRVIVDAVRPYKGDMYLLKLHGIADPETVETLRNQSLCIPVEELAALPPDSYYQHDIIGLQVLTLDGREIGRVDDILETGANDVYVIKGEGQILIPAVKDIIKQIDLIRHTMYIDPIAGLLDDNAVEDREQDTLVEDE